MRSAGAVTASLSRRASSSAALSFVLAISMAAGCDGPSPEKVCASAAQVASALDVNLCIGDLKDEKVNDPIMYDADMKCLAALRTESGLDECLVSPRSLPRFQQKQTRAHRDPSKNPDLAAQMAKLRAVVGRMPGEKEAFDKLLDKASRQEVEVNGQLGDPPRASAVDAAR